MRWAQASMLSGSVYQSLHACPASVCSPRSDGLLLHMDATWSACSSMRNLSLHWKTTGVRVMGEHQSARSSGCLQSRPPQAASHNHCIAPSAGCRSRRTATRWSTAATASQCSAPPTTWTRWATRAPSSASREATWYAALMLMMCRVPWQLLTLAAMQAPKFTTYSAVPHPAVRPMQYANPFLSGFMQ